VIVLAALAAGWLAAFASALLIYAATKITPFSKRFPGFEDAILLLAVCLGPLMMF
jgi:hypothetical protein